MTPQAAHVRERGKHPDRRGAKGDDAERFDGVADRAARQEVVGQCVARLVSALDLADLLDQRSVVSTRFCTGATAALISAARHLRLRVRHPRRDPRSIRRVAPECAQ